MDTGGILLPDETAESGVQGEKNVALDGQSGSLQRKKRQEDGFQTIITWYTGSDLLDRKMKSFNVYCNAFALTYL